MARYAEAEREPVTVHASEIKKETAKAMLITLSDTGEDKWIPNSVIVKWEWEWEVHDGKKYISGAHFTLKHWFALKEGLVEE